MISHSVIPRQLFWKLAACALLVLLAAILCGRISHPWTYNDDYNGAFWSQAARNLDRTGILANAGVPAPLYFGAPPIPAEALYVHHPTLLAELMVADLRLLGGSERAARCLPILFSLLTAALLWSFAGRCAGWRAAAFILAFFIAAPMELHYGQMVNFEAPELFFLLGALWAYHGWRREPGGRRAAACAAFCVAAMWMDWLGYLLVILLALPLLTTRRRRDAEIAALLLMAALLCGVAFLVQIKEALPGAWGELFRALRERGSHADLSGGVFTMTQWGQTEYEYLTTLYHPAAWLLAAAGAVAAWVGRGTLRPGEKALLHTGALLFAMDAIYVCGLRNQSYIHDFASFYFLVPVAIYAGFLIERMLRAARTRWGSRTARVAALACCVGTALLIASGVMKLNGIDTQFCILDNDHSEPETLMPDVGRLIDATFAPGAVVICNFDPYYSPLPFYARRVMVNDVDDPDAWEGAVRDAAPSPVGGIIWTSTAGAAALLRHLPMEETRQATVDGIPFVLWVPRPK